MSNFKLSKICSDCNIEKPLAEFYKSKRGIYGVQRRCKKCTSIRGKKLRIEEQVRKPLIMVYNGMMQRCYRESDVSYKYYGARGIRVCDRWRESYENFEQDIVNKIGLRPTSKHSIDRINTDGDYEINNVRWATYKEQSENKRNNVTYQGKTQSQWANILGVSQFALHAAKKYRKETLKGIVQHYLKRSAKKYKGLTQAQWSRVLGVKREKIAYLRRVRKKTLAEAVEYCKLNR